MLETNRSRRSFLGRLLEPYELLWSRADVLLQTSRMNLLQRHAGSVLGAAWLFLGPALLICAYGYMFIVVFRVQPAGLSRSEYFAHMCCGLVTFIAVSQALSAATTSLTQEPGLVLNRVFPAELIAFREVLMALPILVVGMALSIAWGMVHGTLGWSWFLLPLLLVLTLMALTGCAWVLSLSNLVVRDTPQVLTYLLTLLMLTSPIAYEAASLPEEAKLLVRINPFAHFLTAIQDIVVHGRAPSKTIMLAVLATALVSFHTGYALFRRGKIAIAENI